RIERRHFLMECTRDFPAAVPRTCARADPLPPLAPPPGLFLRQSADRVAGWFYRWCPSPGLLPEWPRQFRLSRIAGLEPIQTRAQQAGKPARRKTALSNPPAPRPAGEFGRAETVQNAKRQLRSGHRPRRKPARESPTR